MTTGRVLVCDPSTQIQRALKVILRDAGYKVQAAVTGRTALQRAAQARPSAVILELTLPDMDGIEVCRSLRRCGPMPIIVLSEIDEEGAKIAAFESGADDYLTKPFSPGELLARLASRLRTAPTPLRFDADGLTIDLAAHLVRLDGREVHLTPTEFMLLQVLATSNGTVSHRTLATRVWGLQRSEAMPRMRAHVANLRAKLDREGRRSIIRTEPSIGYRFDGM
jgi:two-component system, OmpR family, KDP operon response regulator KdpE